MPLTRGQRLRRLREQRRIEIKEAAPAIGISRGYLSLLELGEKGKNLDHVRANLERAAAYYGVLPDYLLAETSQEYLRAYIEHLGVACPATFGGRFGLILKELQLRWGEEHTEDQLAVALGCGVEVIRDYLTGRAEPTDSAVQQISAITGAPTDWLLPHSTSPSKAGEEIQRIVEKAMASGIEPRELDMLLEAWLLTRKMNKPSG
ncbi:MAG TPA: helix-turn-helix transcriptional regulator [Symbiobacteriaceae bacterium]